MGVSLGYDAREWRRKMGWTQLYTALVFDVDRRTVIRWESGAVPVPWTKARIMERLLEEKGHKK